MNIPRFVLALALSALGFSTLACGGPPDGFSEEEWKTVQELGPLPEAPVDPTNKYEADERAATLGQKLFHDRRFAGPIKVDATTEEGALGAQGETGKVACSDCHAGPAMTDLRSRPGNISNAAGFPGRNSPPLANVAYYTWFTWGGKRDTLWGQGAAAFEAGTDVNGDRCNVAHLLFTHYRADYDAVFDHKLPVELEPGHAQGARFPDLCKPAPPMGNPGPWEAMTADDRTAVLRVMSNVGKAFAAYERKLVSGNSALDKYLAGDRDALEASAKRGLKLFIGKGFCVQCHTGSTLQDGRFHNLGVPQEGARVPAEDQGRFGDIALLAYPFRSDGAFSDNAEEGKKKLEGLTATEEDKGAFRTKGLRNVALSAPYYHTGGMATLREVVDFYDRGGGTDKFVGTKSTKLKPLNLTDQDKADLVAFLESLTGEEIPESLRR